MEYHYIQRSPSTIYLWCIAALLVGIACWIGLQEKYAHGALILAVSLVAFSLTTHSLTVMGTGEFLSIRTGQISLHTLIIPYRTIARVRSARFAMVDYDLPHRGRTYTVGGMACVIIDLHQQQYIRIGTQDAENLAKFLESKIRQA